MAETAASWSARARKLIAEALREIAAKLCHGQTTRGGTAIRRNEWMESRSSYCGSCEARAALAEHRAANGKEAGS